MGKRKAILEVEFDPMVMMDQETVDNEYGGDWLMVMQELFAEEGLGLFVETLKLVHVKREDA